MKVIPVRLRGFDPFVPGRRIVVMDRRQVQLPLRGAGLQVESDPTVIWGNPAVVQSFIGLQDRALSTGFHVEHGDPSRLRVLHFNVKAAGIRQDRGFLGNSNPSPSRSRRTR